MLAPSLRALKTDTEIILVGRTPGIGFLQDLTENVLDYERSGWHGLFSENPVDLPDMEKIDIGIAFSHDPEGLVKRNLSKMLSADTAYTFPPFPDKDKSIHTALYLAHCLEKTGLPINPQKAFDYSFKNALLKKAPVKCRKNNIIFHPGSGSIKKNLAQEFWVNLIKAFEERFPGNKKFIVLGPAEEQFLDYFKKKFTENTIEIVFCPDNVRLLEILSSAGNYVGHDSGITHLAAMLGVHTIALFKNNHIQWHPLGPLVALLTGTKESTLLVKEITGLASSNPC